jgi:hypothetical protein
MSRRQRSDSIEAGVKAIRDTSRRLEWPEEITHLIDPAERARALALFQRILEARHIDDWRSADLPLVSQLANATVMSDRLLAEIDQVGFTVSSPKNPEQKLRNPSLDGLQMISARQLALSRMLGLSGLPSDSKTISKNRRSAADARDKVGLTGVETLLAGWDEGLNNGERFSKA